MSTKKITPEELPILKEEATKIGLLFVETFKGVQLPTSYLGMIKLLPSVLLFLTSVKPNLKRILEEVKD
jgi:hypothetical protein